MTFFQPPSPGLAIEEVAAIYQTNQSRIFLGALIIVTGFPPRYLDCVWMAMMWWMTLRAIDKEEVA